MRRKKKTIGFLIGLLACAGLRGPDFIDLAKDVTTTDIATATLTALVGYSLAKASSSPLTAKVDAGIIGVGAFTATGPLYRSFNSEGRAVTKAVVGSSCVVSLGAGLYFLRQGNTKRVADAAVAGVSLGMMTGRMLWQDKSLKSSETSTR